MTDTAPAPDEGVEEIEAPVTNPYEVVRARTRTGAHVSINRVVAETRGYEVLEGRPALDGWGRPLPGKPKKDLTPVDKNGPFDPATQSVAAVQKYLDNTADAAEVTRVLQSEAAGKNRSTIIGWNPPAVDSSQED